MFPAVLLLLLALATPAFAAPSVDRSGSAGDPRVSAALERLRNDPALNRLARVAHIDERYGVPSFVWSNALPAPRPGTTREAAARAHLASLGPLYGLDQRDAREANLRHVHDTGRGAIVASFTQRVGGIDVFLDEINVLMDRSLRPLAVSGYIPSQASTIRGRFRLSAAAALDRALADFGGAAQLTPGHDPRTRKVLFHAGASLVPAWHLELAGPTQAYSYVISAEDGDLLFRNSLMASDVFGYRVWADATPAHEPFDGPQGTTPTPHPTGTPDVYTPPFLAPSLISLQNSPFSMNDPWLPSGATQTTGNNVDAYADLASPDGFGAGDLRATTTSPGVFDRSYDPTQAPGVSANQRMAAITQLFYTINYLHDWYYDAGFNEGAGNAQADNYGRGGVGGDRILAEAQDYSGTNNANMFTPADGASPRMQMYPFTPATAGVVVSGPGISGSRLAGTASFGPQAFNITGSLVLVADGTAPTSDGCSTILNSITGRIALIDRGDCNFSNKAQNAQSAGAIGVVIVDNVEGFVPPLMGGNDPTITIPVLSITKALGDSLKVALGSGPVTLTLDRPAEPWRDGSIDNQIVAHEWGHYISNRVAGGLTNAMGQGMGEGWGDFHAMLMTVRPEDASAPGNTDFGGVYSLSGYAMGGLYSQSYYFGIRRVPYSTDMTKDPFTFQHISDAVTLPPGIPYQIFSTQNSQVHNTGEIWCTMLWECYAALLRDTGRLTFDQARLRMRDYLVAAYQMTPNAPTLTEARDALLAVAAANDAADYVLFWQAFAKRGAGMNAVSPDRNSTTHTPVVESYVAGGDVRFVSLSVADDFISCDQDGYLDEGEIGTLTVTVQNTGAISLNATTGTASSSNPAISFPDGATLTFSPSTPMGLATATLKIKLQGSSGLEAANIQVSFGDAAQVTPQPVVASRNLYVRADAVPSATESAEPATLPWTNDGSSSGADGAFQRLELTPTSHVVFGPDPDGISDQRFESPDLHVAPAGNFVFTFTHKFSFERAGATRYDGGVVEISSDGGQTWTDVNTHGATPGYNGTITNTSGNPLGGRQGYTGTNTGYPSTVLATVNLGTTFAGQTVRVRFRVGTDQAVGAPGWQIDNIAFTNITNTPFLALQSDDPCAPTAVGDAPPTELAFAIEGSMPVRGDVHMRFALPKAGPVEIAVFDVAGRRLETLANGRFDSGIHSLEWKPNGQSGSGVYFVRMSAAGRSLVRRIVALR